MHYRRFGKTGLQMPVITCGGMRFQESFNENEPVSSESQKNVEACVRRALECGINHIETARGYGTSEFQLGRILPGLPRDSLIVQTKVAPDNDVGKFVANFEKSMGLLELDYLDLFGFHGVNDGELLEATMRCLDQAIEWQREGRIRHIGFSTHGPADAIVRAVETDAFAYVNLHWFYVDQTRWPAIEAANKRDMGVMIISPNDKGGLLNKPSDKLGRLTAPLHPMAFNDLFCLSRAEVHALSEGVARPDEFDLHVEAANDLDCAAEVIEPIIGRLEDEMLRTFGKEWSETWDVGLPQWHETPGNVNIPVILWLRNLVLAFDMVEYAKMRYNLLGNGGTWFPGDNAAHVDALDLAEALRNSPHAKVIPSLLKETHRLLGGQARKRLQQDP